MRGESDALPIEPVASSLADLKAMPRAVRVAFGGALRAAQMGQRPEGCRPFGEGIPRQVMKMTVDFETDTYRMAFVGVAWRGLPAGRLQEEVEEWPIYAAEGRAQNHRSVEAGQEHHRRHYRQRRHHAG